MNPVESRLRTPVNKTERSCLRWSLPGEYLATGLMIHAGFGALIWAVAAVRSPACLFLVPIGLWIVVRAAGLFAQRGFAGIISAGLLTFLVIFRQYEFHPPIAPLAVFSLPVFIAMLGFILLLDIVEFVQHRLN